MITALLAIALPASYFISAQGLGTLAYRTTLEL